MSCILPRKVRRAVANITYTVAHKTTWVGPHSNHQKWLVESGGAGWDPGQEVSVTSTPEGVKVIGLEIVERAYAKTGLDAFHGLGFADECYAIRQILAVLEAAVAPSESLEERKAI